MKHDLNIFAYTSYRKFLHDLYEQKKLEAKGFSHRVFVRMCGFVSPNFLKLVIDGKRNLGNSAKQKLAQAICRNKNEKEYLEALVQLEHAGSIEEKNSALSTISRLRHRKNIKTIDVDQYEYLSKWQNVAIRELVSLDDFQEDASWINSKLGTNLSEHTIRNTFDKLINLNLLKRNASGHLVQTDTNVICEPQIFSVAVNNYHREMLEKAANSIETTKSANRDVTGLTVTIDRKAYEDIIRTIKECREHIHHIASTATSKDVVYQIGFQLFNLSEASWKQQR